MDETVFHPGERAVQERTGERATALINGQIVAPRIPQAARGFVAAQRWCVIGAADGEGAMQASLLIGAPGFAEASEDLQTLRLRLDDPARRLPGIAPFASLAEGDAVGLLLIDLETRKRLRVNGPLLSRAADLLEIGVGQSYPACPRYIQKRLPGSEGADAKAPQEHRPPEGPPASGTALDAVASSWIAAADTMFIASAGPGGAADVSHRGGRPGFVEVEGQTLHIPDFNGNSMFNTLGNLTLDPRAGLVVPDFEWGRQLQLTGRARLRFDVARQMERTGGTGRWIDLEVDAWRVTPLNGPLHLRLVEPSRFNP